MILIACLGNPGESYRYTRHNAGFMIGDAIAAYFKFERVGEKFKSIVYSGTINSERVFLLFPQTFMNLSGEAVRATQLYYKLEASDVLIIYDDFDLPLGTLRLREKGSAGTHNGMKSVVECLGTDQLLRLRVGIGPRPENLSISDFVLHSFNKEELSQMNKTQTLGTKVVEALYVDGIQGAQRVAKGIS